MRWEVAAAGAGIGGGLLGFAFGWAVHKAPASRAFVTPLPIPAVSTDDAPKDAFPTYPKPPLERPTPLPDTVASGPIPFGGDISHLPAAGGSGMGPIGGDTSPLVPDLPHGAPPVADLNADEALAKRIVLQAGATIVSVGDARDETGTIGRSIVAETFPTDREALRSALRKALGARAILSDAGTGVLDGESGSKKLEEDLAAARKRRDKDRVDFLPQSPTLRDSEEAVLNLEKALAERRKNASRVRLSILLRPTLSP